MKRTTIELDEDLVKAAQRITGTTVRSTVEEGLRTLIEAADRERDARRARVSAHFDTARDAIDMDLLESDEAWR
ncbi:antitoxin [Mycobacterium sp. NS-7484]|nr:antitoxin [Mycobacterium sp. E802]OMC00962.1 antitoxin [Mycobacterium sp. NS-7484]